ncbi:ATP-dependent DNA helicase RecG [Pelagibacteraceae bacterium]|nr:ATP-dependent DNA helicase RecG [Pelagibacteraceae bacterium]
MRPQNLNYILSSIGILKGVGPKLEKIINKLGIIKNVHFIWNIPSNVIERKYYKNIHDAEINSLVTLNLNIIKHEPSRFRRQPYRIKCLCGETNIDLVFFNARHPVMRQMLPVNASKLISGKLEFFRNNFQITHPTHIRDLHDNKLIKNKEPVYNLTQGLNQRIMNKLTDQVLNNLPHLNEWIDEKILIKYNFKSWKETVLNLHNPVNNEIKEKDKYRRRLAFDELLSHQLAIGIMRNFNQKKKGISIINKNIKLEKFIKNIPFKLTNSQNDVIKEILSDLESSNQMIRLLQGDVGSGKTIVALISMLKVVENKFQSALMVPTTILAYQHFENITNLLKKTNIKVLILTGKDKGKERVNKLKEIANGSADIIIGTHSLIQDTVVFEKLGLAIIDEQHRFGVYQRMVFNHKNQKPNILVMSATPIPRTLTLAAYGDMSESRLIEKPIGRKSIITTSLTLNKEKNLIKRVKEKINTTSTKFYWVCPLIEESEELDLKAAEERYKNLNKYFKNKVLLMHGRLNEEEKEVIMSKFKNEDYKILVSTTVIEVGVDVPSATTIVIEHAERFGLAQLHQLRGRVGRNDIQSYCILLHKDNIGEIAKKRIDIMKNTNDGFQIAEEDLKIRGPGEVLGKKQSGSPSFYIADLSFDSDLLEDTKNIVENILKENPKLANDDGLKLKNLLYLQERDSAILTLLAG